MPPDSKAKNPVPDGNTDAHRDLSDKPGPATSSPSKAKDASTKASSPLVQALPHPTDPTRVVWYRAVQVKNHSSGSKYVWIMAEELEDQPTKEDGSQLLDLSPAPPHRVDRHKKLHDTVMVHKRKKRGNKSEPQRNEALTAEDDWVLDDFTLATDKEECVSVQGLPMEEEEEGWEVITWDWF